MKRSIQLTHDGSATIQVDETDVTYHSRHGALAESMHVFIEAGLLQPEMQVLSPLHILEMGFGTGLNTLLTYRENTDGAREIRYDALEAFPLHEISPTQLGYPALLERPDLTPVFEAMHGDGWDKPLPLSPFFSLTRFRIKLEDFVPPRKYHLVYYDAFAPSAQPELWTEAVFSKIASWMEPGGILVTYCSKGDVRRAMAAAGLTVTKIPGPQGKREMVRAWKK